MFIDWMVGMEKLQFHCLSIDSQHASSYFECFLILFFVEIRFNASPGKPQTHDPLSSSL